MNGAQALIRTLVDAGVDVCFMNPGTSEMHFVAALDDVPEMRGVLALFEGVATGAADGYARMADQPAATLLHLGPGLGNGLANLHNARKAFTPVVNIVGDHATYHKQYDAQLESDIETVARNVSTLDPRVRQHRRPWPRDAADAVAAAIGPPGQVATLILPADVSWSDGGDAAPRRRAGRAGAGRRRRWSPRSPRSCRATSRRPCSSAGGPAEPAPWSTPAASPTPPGAKLLAETFPARLERGAGRVPGRPPRLPGRVRRHAARRPPPPRARRRQVAGVVLRLPRTRPATSCPTGCTVHVLAGRDGDPAAALAALADAVGAAADAATLQAAGAARPAHRRRSPPTPSARSSARCCPRAPSCPTRATPSGLFAAGHTAGRPGPRLAVPHRRRHRPGPARRRSAPPSPPRPAGDRPRRPTARRCTRSRRWWTMAREELDVTTVLFNNSSYAVLEHGARPGRRHRRRREGQGDARPPPPRPRLRRPRHRHGRARHPRHHLRGVRRAAAPALATAGPTVIEAVVPSIL